MRLFWFIANLTTFICLHYSASAQPSTPSNTTNALIEERLRNAQISTTHLNNGAEVTEVRFAGSLEPNVDLGCIPISEVHAQYNPPALLYAAQKCIQQGQYTAAWVLMTTGNGFAYYDLKRLSDRSTSGALLVLLQRVQLGLTQVQNQHAEKAAEAFLSDAQQVQAYCIELQRIGPPTYDPQWAIRHGVGAYREPRNGDYLANVDTAALWQEVLRNRCTPKK